MSQLASWRPKLRSEYVKIIQEHDDHLAGTSQVRPAKKVILDTSVERTRLNLTELRCHIWHRIKEVNEE